MRLIIFFIIISGINLNSQDRIFTYTHQSNVLNTGNIELEIYNTFRYGKENYFARYDNRIEFEIGVLKNLQTAFYFNTSSISKAKESGENDYIIEKRIKSSFSNEWKLKLSDATINPVGMGLYFEYGIGADEFELESKLILDKRFGNFFLATNTIYELEFEPEYEHDELEFEKEQEISFNLALAYKLKKGFHITTEHIIKSKLETGDLHSPVLYSGIGFSLLKEKFWVNFTLLPKVTTLNKNIINSLNQDDYEKFQTRLLFSIYL
ncbi:MAG TPA: hypothetical protein ENK91_03625 [Bacteroidetes bacterium]|nr:hypothetical protein [Bacteroidota bacterium]